MCPWTITKSYQFSCGPNVGQGIWFGLRRKWNIQTVDEFSSVFPFRLYHSVHSWTLDLWVHYSPPHHPIQVACLSHGGSHFYALQSRVSNLYNWSGTGQENSQGSLSCSLIDPLFLKTWPQRNIFLLKQKQWEYGDDWPLMPGSRDWETVECGRDGNQLKSMCSVSRMPF